MERQTCRLDSCSIFKNCAPGESCKITENDLKIQSNDTAALSAAGLVRQEGLTPLKQIDYPVVCSKNIKLMQKDMYFSQTCVFIVGIESPQRDSGSSKTKYELSVEDGLDSHLVNKNHFTYMQ